MPPSLAPGEKFLLVGTYDVAGFSTYNLDVAGNSAYGFVRLALNGLPRMNTTVYNVASVGKPLTPSSMFLAEQYTAHTFRRGNSLGQISWMSIYPEVAINTSSVDLQDFMVTGKSGVYKDVSRVVIDFSSANGIRTVYFIG
jgi:hypothetical protein